MNQIGNKKKNKKKTMKILLIFRYFHYICFIEVNIYVSFLF